MKGFRGTKNKFRAPMLCSVCGREFYDDDPRMIYGEPVCQYCRMLDMEKNWWEETKHDTARKSDPIH